MTEATRICEAHGESGAAGIFFDPQGPVTTWDSAHQRITVFENANFGTVLLLDGLVMTTDRDASFYHEPLVHPAMTAHPAPRRALVIGGGDGGTVTELSRYPELEAITMVEIDAEVVAAAREHFPELTRGLDDERLALRHEDGAAFVEQTAQVFDVIVVDGSDPVGPARALFERRFLRACRDRLAPGGIFVTQSESPLYYGATIRGLLADAAEVFDWHGIYTGAVPTYPGGLWSWSWAGIGAPPEAPARSVPGGLAVYADGDFPRPSHVPPPVRELLP